MCHTTPSLVAIQIQVSARQLAWINVGHTKSYVKIDMPNSVSDFDRTHIS